MLQNYLKLAKSKIFSFINIFGLAAGTLCSLYIILYVQDQYSYDKQYKGDLYRITTIWSAQEYTNNWATVTAPVAPAMKHDFAQVLDYTRAVPAIEMDHHLLKYKDKAFTKRTASIAIPISFRSSISTSIMAMQGGQQCRRLLCEAPPSYRCRRLGKKLSRLSE